MIDGKKFITDWIAENFSDVVEVSWLDNHTAMLNDGKDTMTVELRDGVLYADEKPVSSIPSLETVI